METYRKEYAPKDQELFDRALMKPVHVDQEFNKVLKALKDIMDHLNKLTPTEIVDLLRSGQIKL